MKIKYSIIAAIDKNRGIGKDNALPWHLPEDLEFFKKITTNSIVVMGGNTFDSLNMPDGLPNRMNYVLSDKHNPRDYIENSNVLIFKSLDNLKQVLHHQYKNNKIFVIGGQTMFEQFIENAECLYLTEIAGEFECDTFFPQFDKSNYEKQEIKQIENAIINKYIKK